MNTISKIEYQVWFKDIDPDTGEVSQEMLVANCKEHIHADWIKNSLEFEWFSPKGANDPNREFIVKKLVADV